MSEKFSSGKRAKSTYLRSASARELRVLRLVVNLVTAVAVVTAAWKGRKSRERFAAEDVALFLVEILADYAGVEAEVDVDDVEKVNLEAELCEYVSQQLLRGKQRTDAPLRRRDSHRPCVR